MQLLTSHLRLSYVHNYRLNMKAWLGGESALHHLWSAETFPLHFALKLNLSRLSSDSGKPVPKVSPRSQEVQFIPDKLLSLLTTWISLSRGPLERMGQHFFRWAISTEA